MDYRPRSCVIAETIVFWIMVFVVVIALLTGAIDRWPALFGLPG